MTTTMNNPAAPGSLAGTWFGERLPSVARARLEMHARLATYPPDAVIVREGDPTQDLAVVVSGRVALRLRVPERGMTTILTIEQGDVVGWSALVPPHRATSTVIALEASELIVMGGEDLRAELDADPELAAAVYSALLEALARRLVATRQQLLDLFAQPVCEPW